MKEDKINVFIQKKKDECDQLIKFNIWHGMDSNKLKAWLKNFTTLEEKFFAACVLEFLVYRNEEQLVSMLYDLLTRHLHNQWRKDKNPIYDDNVNPLKKLKQKWGEIGFRYVTAVTSNDPGTKSGYRIINEMNHKLTTSTRWNITCSDIQNAYQDGIRTFLFIDDIVGTGQQMKTILEESQVTTYKDTFVYVLACAAHENGVHLINDSFDNVKVLCAEYLPASCNIFKNLPYSYFDLENEDQMHEWYINFMQNKGVGKKDCLGRGDFGLTYAFEGNVPNDSLPLLYYQNNKLKSLLIKRG